MSKRENKFQKVNEFKERFSSLPLYVLKSRLNTGALTKEASIAINEIIKEKVNDKSVSSEISQSFLNGDKIKNVNFSYNDFVKIINGIEKDKYGSVISLVSLIPEPVYIIEIDGKDGDREIPQSSLIIIDS